MTDDPPFPELAFYRGCKRIAATAWLTSAAAHAAVMTMLIAGQVWIAVPPQMGSRGGPSSMPSKPSPGDPTATDTNEPRGEPIVVSIAPPPNSLPAELVLDDDLMSAIRLDAGGPPPTLVSGEPDFLMEAIVQVAAPVILDAHPIENSYPALPPEEAHSTQQEPPAATPEPLQPETRPTAPPPDPSSAKMESAPVGQPEPPTIASLPSDGNQSESLPRFRNNSPVHYPREAVRQHIEGTVTLRLQIAADGRVSAVEIATSSGHEMLDRAASETVRKWRGEPSRVGGQPVAASILLPVEFRLR